MGSSVPEPLVLGSADSFVPEPLEREFGFPVEDGNQQVVLYPPFGDGRCLDTAGSCPSLIE